MFAYLYRVFYDDINTFYLLYVLLTFYFMLNLILLNLTKQEKNKKVNSEQWTV